MMTLSRAVRHAFSVAVIAPLILAQPSGRAEDVRYVHMTVAQAKGIAISCPMPQYPPGARSARMKGSGVFLVHIRKKTGVVTRVQISKSTGHRALDVAATTAFGRCRFRPGAGFDGLVIPVTFTF